MKNIELIINRDIAAPIEKVFKAWTQPDLIQKWFAPSEAMTIPNTEVDLKVGGKYLIHMHNPETNEDFIVSGTYEEIIENKRLVFNWMWKDGVDRSTVSLDFSKINDTNTRLTLTHTGFSQQEFADKHNEGWNDCLQRLEGVAQ